MSAILQRVVRPSVALLPGRVDATVTAPDAAIRTAQAELTDQLGITAEGAAAAWAARADPDLAGPILLVVTGSNT